MCKVDIIVEVVLADRLTGPEAVALGVTRMLAVELTTLGIEACVRVRESRWRTARSTEGRNS